MRFFYCGFNGFGQFPSSSCSNVEEFMLSQIEHVEDVMFSWNNIIIRTGLELYITGFVDGKPNELKKLDFTNIAITNMTCCSFRQQALFVTESGECWRYKDDNLKLISHFISTEKPDETCGGRVTKVSCGENVNVALSSLGAAYCIPSVLSTPEVLVKDIACGFEHNLLLTECGRVFSWGSGSRGQLGHGDLEDEDAPVEVASLSNVSSISAGGWHSLALTLTGHLYAWGWNNEGQLGLPSVKTSVNGLDVVNVAAAPMLVPLEETVKQAACGNRHTVMMTEGGVWGCGWNAHGQLGSSTHMRNLGLTRLTVPRGEVRRVVAGSWSTGLLMES